MPELPEVQTVINHLNKKIDGQKILNVEVLNPINLKNCTPEQFKAFLMNETILKLTRKGKYIIIHLTNDKIWLVHLRMEGKLIAALKGSFYNNFHTMVRVELTDWDLRFTDTRRFGTFHILYNWELDDFKELKKVAIDPLDKNFNFNYFAPLVKKSKKHIKTLLLDQSVVSGIGNIYADEILFRAHLHPLKIANTLTDSEIQAIVDVAPTILMDAIKNKGTTIHSFAVDENTTGKYQSKLMVHSHKLKNCKVCGGPLTFTKVNGRGTFICENCQKK